MRLATINRKSTRLRQYDYSRNGYYFVTICTQEREDIFGCVDVGADPRVRPENQVNQAQIILNPPGQMIDKWIRKISGRYDHVDMDEYVVMPDHIHMIIFIHPSPDNHGRTHGCAPTLGRMIQWFKTMTTNRYIRGVRNEAWKPFRGRLWQRNYYERVIRNEHELLECRQYIRNNPQAWAIDEQAGTYQ